MGALGAEDGDSAGSHCPGPLRPAEFACLGGLREWLAAAEDDQPCARWGAVGEHNDGDALELAGGGAGQLQAEGCELGGGGGGDGRSWQPAGVVAGHGRGDHRGRRNRPPGGCAARAAPGRRRRPRRGCPRAARPGPGRGRSRRAGGRGGRGRPPASTAHRPAGVPRNGGGRAAISWSGRRRLYRMRLLYWAARDMAAGVGDQERLATARADYRAVLAEWNDNLNRNLALIETYFGTSARDVMSGQIYEGFAVSGRGLEEIVKMVSAAGGDRIEVPRFGHRITRLSRSVYALNLQMLRLLREDSIGRAAPQGIGRAAPREIGAAGAAPGGRPLLQIGDQGREVRRLQRALRRAGEKIDIDGHFRQKTWMAVCSLQRSRGLDVDGIAGPRTWAALPPDAQMPLLRIGSEGDPVAGLQRVLIQHASGRWAVSPEAVTGVFDAGTSAAVQAFQRWSGITADGLVGDQNMVRSGRRHGHEPRGCRGT